MNIPLRIALMAPVLMGLAGCKSSFGSYSLFGGYSECGCGSSVTTSPASGKVSVIEPPLAPTEVATPAPIKAK